MPTLKELHDAYMASKEKDYEEDRHKYDDEEFDVFPEKETKDEVINLALKLRRMKGGR